MLAVALLTSCRSIPPSAPTGEAATPPGCVAVVSRPLGPRHGTLFGVNLDWGHEQLSSYADRLGHHPAVAVSFSVFPFDAEARVWLVGAVDQARSQGATLLLTLEPRLGLAAVTPAAAEDLGRTLAKINAGGVPVVVRFAHEMNGSWYAWGQQPTAYVAAFRRVASAVHRLAPGSATMWAPNYGGGYPFAGGRHTAGRGTPDAALLDTDHNGVVEARDDPYAPYWPGDDAVDWVGLSLYHWGTTYPWGANVLPEPGKFVQQLTGTYVGPGGDDRAVPDFYATYGDAHNKPVAIPETAALLNTSRDTTSALAIKGTWWRQVLDADVPSRFPRLKMINWFEWNKGETEIGTNVDWTATGDPTVRAAFRAALPDWLVFGTTRSCRSGS